MSNNACLLSFTIPVYNGANTILETLESLYQECDRDCEIVVLDNCSNDGTKEIVSDFQARSPMVRYVRNMENLGYDRNFNKCFEHAYGEYVWIVGDDDLVRPGAVKKVREVLAEHENLGFIYVNYAIVNRLSNRVSKERDLEIFQDRLLHPGLEAVLLLQEYPNFISSLIFKRKAWLEAGVERYFDTLYSQYGVFLDVTNHQKSYCISEPFVENKCRINNLDHKPEFYKSYLTNFISLVCLINSHDIFNNDKVSKNLIISGLFNRHFLKYVKTHQLMGGEFKKIHVKVLWNFVRSRPRHYFALFLYLVPGGLIRNIQYLRSSFRKLMLGKDSF